ncbi:YggU-like protein [Stipitochalara longipes BDJ]|nr:YggU-like protein [Stipitochalara longipes BDJ]
MYVYLQCHVKPGSAKQREGVVSVSDVLIEVCVSAQPRDGLANSSVRKVFSDVFKCPKSNIEIIRGLKSREKTVAIAGIDIQGNEEECILRLRKQLESAIE